MLPGSGSLGTQSMMERGIGGTDREYLTPMHIWRCSNVHTGTLNARTQRDVHCTHIHVDTSACTQFRAMCIQAQMPTDPHMSQKKAESNTLHSALPRPEVSPSLSPLPPPSHPPPQAQSQLYAELFVILGKDRIPGGQWAGQACTNQGLFGGLSEAWPA